MKKNVSSGVTLASASQNNDLITGTNIFGNEIIALVV